MSWIFNWFLKLADLKYGFILVTLIGGVVFLLFAVSALFFSPEEEPVNVP